eukprot:1141041-Pelagomonas_calceolata.AAC.2
MKKAWEEQAREQGVEAIQPRGSDEEVVPAHISSVPTSPQVRDLRSVPTTSCTHVHKCTSTDVSACFSRLNARCQKLHMCTHSNIQAVALSLGEEAGEPGAIIGAELLLATLECCGVDNARRGLEMIDQCLRSAGLDVVGGCMSSDGFDMAYIWLMDACQLTDAGQVAA